MPASTDPVNLSPDDRARELATLFAAGLVRLYRLGFPADNPPTSPPESSPENSPDSAANRLAVPGEKSVTVHTG